MGGNIHDALIEEHTHRINKYFIDTLYRISYILN